MIVNQLKDGEKYDIHTESGFKMAVLVKRGGKHYGQHPQKGERELTDSEAEEVYEYIESEVAAGCVLLLVQVDKDGRPIAEKRREK